MVKKTKKHKKDLEITHSLLITGIELLRNRILHNNIKCENIYGIPRGGSIIAVYLSHILRLPVVVNKQDITEKTLIVDDICDTGRTLKKYKKNQKLVLVCKNKGLKEIGDNLQYAFGVDDTVWVRFPWEVDYV